MDRWVVRTDGRHAACALVALLVYSIPWIYLQARWPILVPEPVLPPVAVTLLVGLGGFFLLFGLLAYALPRALKRRGWRTLARRWKRGARHASWPGHALAAIHVGMRLPVAVGGQVGAAVVLVLAGAIAALLLGKRGLAAEP